MNFLLVLQPLSVMSRADRLHSRTTTFCFRCGRGHDSRLGDRGKSLLHISIEKIIFCSYFIGSPEPQLWPPYGIKWVTRHLFKYTSRHGGPGNFRDQFENLQDDIVNWTPYNAYHDDLPGVYCTHFNL
jgi:hypothetical protein